MSLYKSKSKTVSIVLPTYNRANLIGRAIDSILNQSYKNWELIIVDDGSTDNTKEILKPYLSTIKNIKYHFHINSGVAISMNMGIELSTGDYITFLGSDDEYMNNHLDLRVKYFESHLKVDILHSTAKIIGDEFVKDKNDLSKKIHLNECILGGTLFGKRKVYEKLGGFKKLSYSPESEFIERAKKRFDLVKLNEPTYIYYRDTPDSICNNI